MTLLIRVQSHVSVKEVDRPFGGHAPAILFGVYLSCLASSCSQVYDFLLDLLLLCISDIPFLSRSHDPLTRCSTIPFCDKWKFRTAEWIRYRYLKGYKGHGKLTIVKGPPNPPTFRFDRITPKWWVLSRYVYHCPCYVNRAIQTGRVAITQYS